MMPTHPLAELIPPMSEDEFRELRDDIRAVGLREPITLFEGKVLDGRHRARACAELELEPATRQYGGDDPAEFVLSLNLRRRHLTTGQRAAVAVSLLDYERARARERQGARTDLAGTSVPIETKVRGNEARATARAGERLGISRSSVERAQRVADQRPDLHERVRAGEISVNRAFEETTGRRLRDGKPLGSPRPFDVTSPRNRLVANKARERLATAVAGLDGYREGLEDFDVRRALAVADPEEVEQWIRMLRSSAKTLRRLCGRLETRG